MFYVSKKAPNSTSASCFWKSRQGDTLQQWPTETFCFARFKSYSITQSIIRTEARIFHAATRRRAFVTLPVARSLKKHKDAPSRDLMKLEHASRRGEKCALSISHALSLALTGERAGEMERAIRRRGGIIENSRNCAAACSKVDILERQKVCIVWSLSNSGCDKRYRKNFVFLEL